MFCVKCGMALPSDSSFCPSCGKQLSSLPGLGPTVRNDRTKRGSGFRVVVGLLFGLGIAIYFASSSKPSSSLPDPAVSERPKPVNIAKHSLGDQFSIGYWTYRCDSADWWSSIPTEYNEIKFPDAAFLVVKLYVRNNDKTASTLPAAFKLVDEQGREYNKSDVQLPESYPPFYLKGGGFDAFKQLNPSVATTGAVVFDVPRNGTYSLKVSGGYGSGEYALIDLTPRGASVTGASVATSVSSPSSAAAPQAESTTIGSVAAGQADLPTDMEKRIPSAAIAVEANNLLAEYDQDEKAAIGKYRDNAISVTGVLSGVFIPHTGISLDSGLPVVTMGGPRPTSVAETSALPGLLAYSDRTSLFGLQDPAQAASLLIVDRTITLTCTTGQSFRISEHTTPHYSIILKDCTVKPE